MIIEDCETHDKHPIALGFVSDADQPFIFPAKDREVMRTTVKRLEQKLGDGIEDRWLGSGNTGAAAVGAIWGGFPEV